MVSAVLLVMNRENDFVRGYAARSLNLQLVFAVNLTVAAFVLIPADPSVFATNVVYGFCEAVYLYCVAVSLMGTMAAANGVVWKYPINLPLFR